MKTIVKFSLLSICIEENISKYKYSRSSTLRRDPNPKLNLQHYINKKFVYRDKSLFTL